jgi:hypothetical protein
MHTVIFDQKIIMIVMVSYSFFFFLQLLWAFLSLEGEHGGFKAFW